MLHQEHFPPGETSSRLTTSTGEPLKGVVAATDSVHTVHYKQWALVAILHFPQDPAIMHTRSFDTKEVLTW